MHSETNNSQAEDYAPDSSQVQIAPLPRISVQAFCESSDTAALIDDIANDRRLSKVHVKVHAGGAPAAIEAYSGAPTPNLILLESNADVATMVSQLDSLAEFCDPGTKVVILGRSNDIQLYRELTSRGVSDYLVTPLDRLTLIRSLSELYNVPGTTPLGRVIAVTGSRGGTGSSTIAHNIAWSLSRNADMSTIIVDMDLAFGTAGLDFNQDPPQSIADAVFSPDRLDANMLDKLMSKCTEKLAILAAPATLDRAYDFPETAFDGLLDLLRASTPLIVLDLPHHWTAWSRRMLVGADDVVIVASPDLASLRNTKNLMDSLRASRPNDSRPKLVLNMAGVPKRPEIAVADFGRALDVEAVGVVPFEPKIFGTASNNGQMLSEVDPKSKISETIDEIASSLMGRPEIRSAKRSLLSPLVSRFRRKKAS